jgi:hypothetical protein
VAKIRLEPCTQCQRLTANLGKVCARCLGAQCSSPAFTRVLHSLPKPRRRRGEAEDDGYAHTTRARSGPRIMRVTGGTCQRAGGGFRVFRSPPHL